VATAANISTATDFGASTMTTTAVATVVGATPGAVKVNPFGSEAMEKMMTKNESMWEFVLLIYWWLKMLAQPE